MTPPNFDTVSFYSKDDCPWCDLARKLLVEKGIKIAWERKVGRDVTPAQFKTLAASHNWSPATVPLIFYYDKDDLSGGWTLIGGYTELEKYFDHAE